jgi:hypothetical protein
LIFPSCFLSLGTARWQLSSAQHSFRLRFRIADLLLGMILVEDPTPLPTVDITMDGTQL